MKPKLHNPLTKKGPDGIKEANIPCLQIDIKKNFQDLIDNPSTSHESCQIFLRVFFLIINTWWWCFLFLFYTIIRLRYTSDSALLNTKPYDYFKQAKAS